MNKHPNIVFVFGDEWRGQAVGYAGDINCHTPHLDSFSKEAINLTNAVSGCPVCCPYRASLLTGQYPLTHGIFINDVELKPDVHSIARAFGGHGYRTAYIGKWHLYGSPDGKYGRRKTIVPREYQLGFDYWKGFECNHDYNESFYYFNDDPTRRSWKGYDAFDQSRDAAAYIRDHASDDSPFMLMLSWGPPHFPLHSAPDVYRKMYKNRNIVLRPNVPESLRSKAQEELRGYYAHIAALDDAFATVRNAVVDAGIDDNTIFVFTSDHGDMRQCHGLDTKLYPWEESIRVPFLIRLPDLPDANGSQNHVPMDAPDIMPTLLGLCNLPIPESVEGTDWSPFIRGEKTLTGNESSLLMLPVEFAEFREYGLKAYRGVRSRRFTYARTHDGPWLLYDNESDPYQMHNVVNTPKYADDQAHMERLLKKHLDRTGDRFLDGRTYLEQAGLSHYDEANAPCLQPWHNPWK